MDCVHSKSLYTLEPKIYVYIPMLADTCHFFGYNSGCTSYFQTDVEYEIIKPIPHGGAAEVTLSHS